MRSILLIVCVSVALTAAEPSIPAAFAKEPGTILHVATSGNDQGDGSAERPFASIQRAAQVAQPGTAIRLHPGTYRGLVWLADLRGSAEAPISLGGVPGEPKPVIAAANEGIHLSKPSWLLLHDLVITGARQNGINIDDGGQRDDESAASHVVLRDLEIRDTKSSGNNDACKISGLYDFVIIDCVFHGWGGSGIDHVGCHRGLITGYRFTAGKGQESIQCKGGTADILITRNRFIDYGDRGINLGGTTGDQYFRPVLSTDTVNYEAQRIHIVGNLFVNGKAPVAFVGSRDGVFAHNTVIDPKSFLMRILREKKDNDQHRFSSGGRHLVVNNLFYFARSQLSQPINIGRGTAPEKLVFRGNCWYAHDAPKRSAIKLPSEEQGGLVGDDPQLIDPKKGDYRPAAGSPLIGAGWGEALDGWEAVAADFDRRSFGDPPSIGAFAPQD